MRRRSDVGLMLGQRRRRWANIKPTSELRLVFAEISQKYILNLTIHRGIRVQASIIYIKSVYAIRVFHINVLMGNTKRCDFEDE